VAFFALTGLAAAGATYKEALPGYHFEFPRDHFAHPGFRTEWWYYTGNVRTTQGERFGFELVFFRQKAGESPAPPQPPKPANPSVCSVPVLGIVMECTAALPNQELVSEHGGMNYWEGAVRYSGSATGVGYLEMTGYDKAGGTL